MADGKTKIEILTQASWPETPRTSEPRLPAMCDKNVFRLFHSSANGKPHIFNKHPEYRYNETNETSISMYNINNGNFNI